MNKLIVIALVLLFGCSSYKLVRVEAKTPGDRVYYNERICYSPCTVKIKIENNCNNTMTIKIIDRNYMITYIQLLGCTDTTIRIK